MQEKKSIKYRELDSTDFIICWKDKFRLSNYDSCLEKGDKESLVKIADSIQNRFLERYIWPCTNSKFKSGFNMMANCCLLIEAIEAFNNGWDVTPQNGKPFKAFFTRNKAFSSLSSKKVSLDFYENIRCGILHQGEIKNGWKIRRNTSLLFDSENKIIDANCFIKEMENTIIEYCDTLKRNPSHKEIWNKAKRKMNFIRDNCQVKD